MAFVLVAITVWSFLVAPRPPEKPPRPAAPCRVPGDALQPAPALEELALAPWVFRKDPRPNRLAEPVQALRTWGSSLLLEPGHGSCGEAPQKEAGSAGSTPGRAANVCGDPQSREKQTPGGQSEGDGVSQGVRIGTVRQGGSARGS